MAELTDAPAPLDAKETAQLTEFARACKAAARAVVLYPPGHPAIAATLGRIAAITSPPALEAPLRLRVLPDGLLLDDRTPARADASLSPTIREGGTDRTQPAKCHQREGAV